MEFEVIADIPEGYETTANVGDILTLRLRDGFPTLFKGDKALCDVGSEYGKHYCKPIK